MFLVFFCYKEILFNLWLQIGPVRLPDRLNGENSLTFLQEQLPQLIADLNLPQHVLNNLYFQHDGAAPHYSAREREHLNNTYPNRWYGR